MSDRRLARASALYRVLLRAFPRAYRAEHGEEMLAFFRERYAEERAHGGAAARRYVLRASWDVVQQGLAERFTPDADDASYATESRGRGSAMNGIGTDVAHALRTIGRNPGWAAVIIATMGLAIAASTVIFTVFDAVLIRPLPFGDPDRLVLVETYSLQSGERMPSNLPDIGDWRTGTRSFTGMAAYDTDVLTVQTGDQPERMQVDAVSSNFFGVVGVAPALGRAFTNEEGVFGRHRVVVLRYEYWATRFGSRASAVGSTLRIGGVPYTIVGVMPQGWPGAWSDAQVWRPMAYAADDWRVTDRDSRSLDGVFARLRPGVSVAAADADVRQVAARLQRAYRESNANVSARARALREAYTQDSRTPLRALFGAVGFLLLIGCANVANMMLARSATREREVAVRRALGASRFRLARLYLIESITLGLCGGLVGVVLSRWLLAPALRLSDDRIFGLDTLTLDARALAFALAVSVGTALLFGFVPVLHAVRGNLQSTLREGRSPGSSRTTQDTLGVLMAVEVALAVVLLNGAGLLMQSLRRESAVDLGFETRNALALRVTLLGAAYPSDTARLAFWHALDDRLRDVPDVRAAGITFFELPLIGGDWWTYFGVSGTPTPASRADWSGVRFGNVSGDYFEALGVRIVRGRALTRDDDRLDAPRVAVINEQVARKHFPNQDPIGKEIWLLEPGRLVATVVGVSADVRMYGAAGDVPDAVFISNGATTNGISNSQWIVLRTEGDPASLSDAVRAAVRDLDRSAAIDREQTLEQIARNALAPARFNTILAGVFAAIALLLAGVGLYGVVSYGVNRRRRDIGIRMALGAKVRDAVTMVLRGALVTVLTGLVVGIVVAIWVGRLLTTLLFGVEPADPMTLLGVSGMLVFVTLIASFGPARIAARVPPTEAMRID